MAVSVFDRKNKRYYEEKGFGSKQLKFLYHTTIGRIILRFFISRTYSKFNARWNHSKKSIKKIRPFVEQYEINLSDFEDREYKSFNDFFIRKIKKGKRKIHRDKNSLIAIADSKLLVYKIDENLNIKIKNSIYTVAELIKDEKAAKEFKNGFCFVFRLTVDDYHRYIFFDEGVITDAKEIKGVLHTVTPIATNRHKVFSENYRICSTLMSENFGEVMQIEIGAILVGKIQNHKIKQFHRGDEKGYFEFGGSTIVLLFKENTIKIDGDILENSKMGIETKVALGERIGEKF